VALAAEEWEEGMRAGRRFVSGSWKWSGFDAGISDCDAFGNASVCPRVAAVFSPADESQKPELPA